MDLRYSEAEEKFRSELRAWLAEVLPTLGPKPSSLDWPGRRVYDTTWQRLLYDAGYAGIDWPPEGGGRSASPVEHLIYLEELEKAHAPYVGVNFVGLLHAGPTIVVEGTPEQRARFLPPILRGDEVWCQGFSEPGAGSDLASLRCKAVRDGDEYVVTGQKIWTSHAEVADYCELLVRTGDEDSRHRGISWLAMPMDRARDRLPAAQDHRRLDRVRRALPRRGPGPGGQPAGRGERRLAGDHGHPLLRTGDGLRLRGPPVDGVPPGAPDAWPGGPGPGRRPMSAGGMGHLGAELDALWALARRNVSQAARTGVPGVGGSVYKLGLSELRQRIGEFGMDLIDGAGLSWDELDGLDGHGPIGNAELVNTWVHGFSRTIAAGTSQIQRNIIAERILGLPKG